MGDPNLEYPALQASITSINPLKISDNPYFYIEAPSLQLDIEGQNLDQSGETSYKINFVNWEY